MANPKNPQIARNVDALNRSAQAKNNKSINRNPSPNVPPPDAAMQVPPATIPNMQHGRASKDSK